MAVVAGIVIVLMLVYLFREGEYQTVRKIHTIEELNKLFRTAETRVEGFYKVFKTDTGEELALVQAEARKDLKLIYLDGKRHVLKEFSNWKALLAFLAELVANRAETAK